MWGWSWVCIYLTVHVHGRSKKNWRKLASYFKRKTEKTIFIFFFPRWWQWKSVKKNFQEKELRKWISDFQSRGRPTITCCLITATVNTILHTHKWCCCSRASFFYCIFYACIRNRQLFLLRKRNRRLSLL